MKVEDLIQLLNNRLREFKLSQNYAIMSGDLERVVSADKEIIALEDTLFKLSLLVDASKSAVVKETTVAEVITDGSVSVLSEYDITPYATDPLHEEKILTLLSAMGIMDTVEQIGSYIKGRYENSPVTGEMVMNAAKAYTIDARLMMAIMELDSRFGTVGIAVTTINPGNVGNDDGGNTRTYDSWQDGVTAVAEWLSRHRITATSPALEPVPEPVPATEPVPEPTPALEPVPETTPAPEPVPETTPATEPVPEPTPAPEPVPETTPAPVPVPEPVPATEPVPEPTPAPEPVPETTPAPEPTPDATLVLSPA